MTIADSDIDEYLTRYAASLAAFDASASADLWAIPGTIVDDHFSGVLDDRDAMVAGLEQSYPLYRTLGLASVTYDRLGVQHLTDALSLVHVRWTFLDSEGHLLTDSTAYYLLRREVGGLRACVCVQVDDAEKLRALAAERGIAL